jgi:carboxypeptidase C (cathepsin A)
MANASQSVLAVAYMQPAYAKASTVDWKVGDGVAGHVRSGGGLTFAAVEGAGHMVPMDQPAAVS